MSEKSRPEARPRPMLVVPVVQAREELSARIEKGEIIARTQIDNLADLERLAEAHKIWRDLTRQTLLKLFTDEQVADMFQGSRSPSPPHNLRDLPREKSYFVASVKAQVLKLRSIREQLPRFPLAQQTEQRTVPGGVDAVENLLRRFHTVVRQLRRRHANRPTLDVKDEYDVQDLLHALLRIYYDEVGAEELAPGSAGASPAIAFVLKAEQMVIEARLMREGLDAQALRSQLLADIGYCSSHYDCRTLIFFIYDPDGRIPNPEGFEQDISRPVNGMKVRLVIAPEA